MKARIVGGRSHFSQNRVQLRVFTPRAPASGFQQNTLREMLYILARFASPSHRTLVLGRSDLIQRVQCRVSNCFERCFQRLVRRVHKLSSNC
jgi:hypothetical protein